MNLLLDTHILLWWLEDHPSLREKDRESISNTENLIILSAAVIWEIRIKQALGKLEIASNFYQVVQEQGFEMISISPAHAYAVGDLPNHHRDPFDRILIAQAMMEGFTMVTHDAVFEKYDISLLS